MYQLSCNLGASTSWNPQGLSWPVMGLLYLYLNMGWCKKLRCLCFTPDKGTLYPLYRTLGGPQGRCWRVRKMCSPWCDPRTVQPVASRYTHWAIPAHTSYLLDPHLLLSLSSYKTIFLCYSPTTNRSSFTHVLYVRLILRRNRPTRAQCWGFYSRHTHTHSQ
jgi:hypothetical protein